jgi:hypothetical protein
MSKLLEFGKVKMRKIENSRQEVVDFVLKNGIYVVRLGQNKNPIDKDWTNPAVYEAKQNEWLEGFLHNFWYLGAICGVKCKNGYYLVVWDADSKEAYEVAKQFENRTTAVKSGGEKSKKTDEVGKEISRHLYFFSRTLPPTKRQHKEGQPEYDFQGKGAQVCLPMTIHPKTHREYVFLNNVAPMIWEGDIYFDFMQMVNQKLGKEEKESSEKIDITMLLNGVDQGNRDLAGIQIATWCRIKGKTQDEAIEVLKAANAKNKPPIGSEPGDVDEDSWIKAKVASAWRGEEPYHFSFIEHEPFTEKQLKEAQELIDNPDRVPFYIHEALADVVREDKTKVLLVILIFAKQSEEVTGKSGSGKSEMVKRALECFPKEWYDVVSGLTDKALRWFEGELRILVITERKGMQTGEEGNAEYDIKVGISEGEIKIIYPEKGPDGKLHKGEKCVRIGCFVFTSTDPAPPEELENRINNLVSDESVEQNKAVLRYIGDSYGKAPDDRISKVSQEKKAVLRCYFKMLEKEAPSDVIIPYLSLIIDRFFIPYANEPSVRRHGYKLVSFIQSMAKIFYKSLPAIGNAVVASPEVFWYVWRLAEETIFSELIMMNPRQLKIWQIVGGLLNENETVTVSQISEKCSYSPGHVKRFLDFFERKSLIEIGKQGRSYEVKRLGKLGFGQTCISDAQTFTLAELKTVYEEWLQKNTCKLAKKELTEIKLIDPTTGSLDSCKYASIVFKLGEIFKTKFVVEKQPVTKMQELPTPMNIEDAFKNEPNKMMPEIDPNDAA